MEQASTRTGEQRVAACAPPADFFPLLANFPEMQDQLPMPGKEHEYALLLYKAIYGLREAPRLWYLEVRRALGSLGFVVSKFDETMMYLRKSNNTYGGTTGQLCCCLTAHVDDLGATGEATTLSWLQGELESRYGALTVQENQFLHVGYEYTQQDLSLIHIRRCRRPIKSRSRRSP